jgi:hypothetical protein
MRRSLTIASLMLATLTAAGCGGTKSSSSRSPEGESTLACGHWANIRSDVRAGILTDSELRAKIGEVRSSATSSPVRSAATTLLAGVTANSKTTMTAGYTALNEACSK